MMKMMISISKKKRPPIQLGSDDKMAGFEDANFENHLSIASGFVKFLATNTCIEGMAVWSNTLTRCSSLSPPLGGHVSSIGLSLIDVLTHCPSLSPPLGGHVSSTHNVSESESSKDSGDDLN